MINQVPFDPWDEVEALAEQMARSGFSASSIDAVLNHPLVCCRVQNIAARFLRDKYRFDDYEDLSQEIMLKLFCLLRRGKYTNTGYFQNWLSRIARNEAIDHYNMRKRRTRKESISSDAHVEDCLDGDPDPLSVIAEDEQVTVLRDCLEQLTELRRNTFILRIYNELSYGQIARILDISEKTVGTRIHEARKSLQNCIETKQAGGFYDGENAL